VRVAHPGARKQSELGSVFAHSKALRILASIALLAVAAWILISLFGPKLPYKIAQQPDIAVDSPDFVRMLEALSDAGATGNNHAQVLTNGDEYYPAELQAIHNARSSVDIEAYIFEKGEIADQFLQALTERAQAGIQVRVVADAVGSLSTTKGFFKPLTSAGGHVAFFHPLKWYTWPHYNNRTHREIIVVDGKIGFIGGSGIADHWYKAKDKDHPRWRDTMLRVDGDAVRGLQGTFAENWVEASGELLAEPEFFPAGSTQGHVIAMVVNSTPSVGRATRARMLYQTLLKAARQSIYITTPYFLPDESARSELIDAKRRGVEVKIITPGKKSDHMLTRSSSHAVLGDLLKNGIEVYEYEPSMIHAKVLIVDGHWAVVGSTNIDDRSFEHNDEVNLAALDGDLPQQLTRDFENDLKSCRRFTYDDWKHRSLWERAMEWLGMLIAREQ
jgi:cardiolipin synthase